MKKIGPWKRLSSKQIYSNPWMRIREDKVIRPDGKKGIYGILETVHNSVFIVAVDDHGRIIMHKQFRYTTGIWDWELPAGWMDDGETPVKAAKRELLEETGFAAKKWKLLGSCYIVDGFSDAKMFVMMGTGLSKAPGEKQKEEGIVKHKFVSQRQIRKMMRNGDIMDGLSLCGIFFALDELKLIK